MSKFVSIKKRLVRNGLVVVSIPLIAVSMISVIKSSSSLLELSKKRAMDTAVDLAVLMDKSLESEIVLAETLASDASVIKTMEKVNKDGHTGSGSDIKPLFNRLSQQYAKMGNNYQGIFITGTDGILFTGILESGKEYKGSNISTREYFNQAKTTRKTVVGNIVKSKTTNNLICVVCVPLFDKNGAFSGVFGSVLKIEYLMSLVSDRKLGKTGYGYMVNNKGIMISHPVPKHILTLDISKLKGMETFVKKMLKGGSGVEEYTFQGVDKIAGYAQVKKSELVYRRNPRQR